MFIYIVYARSSQFNVKALTYRGCVLRVVLYSFIFLPTMYLGCVLFCRLVDIWLTLSNCSERFDYYFVASLWVFSGCFTCIYLEWSLLYWKYLILFKVHVFNGLFILVIGLTSWMHSFFLFVMLIFSRPLIHFSLDSSNVLTWLGLHFLWNFGLYFG